MVDLREMSNSAVQLLVNILAQRFLILGDVGAVTRQIPRKRIIQVRGQGCHQMQPPS